MRAITRAGLFLVAACAAFGVLAPAAFAQTVYGSMAGTVSDSSGAVVSGAKVQAKSAQTGATTDTVTSAEGIYRFPELPIGAYDVTISAGGFQNETLTGVQVNLQITTALDVKLKVGGTTVNITVNASAPQLQTESSDITGSVTDQEYLNLPLALGGVGALRSPEAFIFLLPGNTGPGTANSPNGIFFSKIAGGQDYGAEVLIDGLSQQRSENGSSFDEEAPSVDALQQLTVTDAVPPAEFNRTTGGFENFVTKSGSNTFHGEAYELLRNTALDANLWFNGGNGAIACSGANNTSACRSTYATPVDHKNDYGGTLGGPVKIPGISAFRDRVQFFFAWEQLKYTLGATTTTTVPLGPELSGDFSNPAILTTNKVGTNPCDGSNVYQGQIFDPSTTKLVGGTECRTAYPGNKITTGFSPASKAILAYYPAATNPNSIINNFQFSSSSPIENTTSTIRIDAAITQKQKIWSSYSDRDNNRVSGTPQILPYPIDPNTWKQDFETHFWRLGWDYTMTPTILNHLIVGSNRSNSKNYAYPVLQNTDWFAKLGIGNAASKNFPVITNGNTVQEGMPNNGDNVDNGLRVVESVSWQKGAHSLTFGTDDRYQQYTPLNGNSPTINFCNSQTAVDPDLASSTGYGLASEELGLACNGNQNLYAHQSRWISWYYSGYVQDDWKVGRNLTLNLGVNYSVDVPRHEADNFTSNFSPTAIDPEYGVPGALVFGTSCTGCNTKWANTYYKDIAPRVGFAWSPSWLNNKTVLRGGAGILFGPLQYDDFGGSMNAGYKSNPVFPSKNGFDPSFQIDSGFPAFAAPPDLDPGAYNGTYLPGSYIEKNAGKAAEIYNYDLNVQQQLATDLIMSIGFVGSEAQNLQANNQNINNMPLQDLSLGDELSAPLLNNPYGVATPFPGYFTLWGNGVQVQQALRPFPQYDFIDSGCCLQSTGHSSYDAMLVSLTRQFHQGLSLQLSYTWQKNLNDTDSALPNTNPGQPQVQNPADLRQEKAISVQDLTNMFVASYLYEFPFGRGKQWLNHGPLSYVIGGWKFGGILRYQDGQPITFCCASGIPGWQQSIYYSFLSNPQVKSPIYRSGWKKINPFSTANGSDPSVNSFFNGSIDNPAPAYANNVATPAFVDINLDGGGHSAQRTYRNGGPFHLGDVPRVTNIRMPAWENEDFSLLKDFPIHESLQFEIKSEFLNAFNRHLFGTPDTNPGDYGYGIPTYQSNSPRAIQITGRIMF